MDVTLVVVGGKTTTSEVKLSLPTVIGRGQECQLKLPQPLVSRRHCELFARDGRLLVRDLGSMNGTYIGSERISEAELPHEGLLTIGAVTFRAIYNQTDARTPDGATHPDLGAETRSDILPDQSVEVSGPMEPLEIEGFEEFSGNQNDLTLPAPPSGSPAPPSESTETPTDDVPDEVLPPVASEASEDTARAE